MSMGFSQLYPFTALCLGKCMEQLNSWKILSGISSLKGFLIPGNDSSPETGWHPENGKRNSPQPRNHLLPAKGLNPVFPLDWQHYASRLTLPIENKASQFCPSSPRESELKQQGLLPWALESICTPLEHPALLQQFQMKERETHLHTTWLHSFTF